MSNMQGFGGGNGGYQPFTNQHQSQHHGHNYRDPNHDTEMYGSEEDDEDVGVEYMPNSDYEGEEPKPSENQVRDIINSYECQ